MNKSEKNLKNKETVSGKLFPAQRTAVEMLDVFVGVCEKYGLHYVLGEHTVLGAYEKQGFMPWTYGITVIMLLDEYEKFVKISEDEFRDTPYYLMTNSNTEQFYDYFARMKKRSKVKLGDERSKDEKYYDFHINIKVGFYAGNAKKEFVKMQKEYRTYLKCANARKFAPDTLKWWKIRIKHLKRMYYIHKKQTYDFTQIKHTLYKYTKPTRYVYVPSAGKHRGVVIETKQYTERERCIFEGKEYYTVSNSKKYLEDFYGKNYRKGFKNKKINQAQLEGPEILRRVQLIELELLIEFDRICRKNNIKYILGAGTALGAVRHKGFIPWDDDVDVFMLPEEYFKFIKVANDELEQEKFFLKTQESDKDNNLAFVQLKRNGTKYMKGNREQFDTHPGILIDIFPFFNAPKTKFAHWKQDKVCKFYRTMLWSHMGITSVKKLHSKIFYSILSRVPNKVAYDKFLKCANKIQKPNDKLCYFFIKRNIFNNPITDRKTFEEIVEMEFEGHMFYMTKHWERYLEYTFSKDYMLYPRLDQRTQKHMPAIVDPGELYEFDE